MLGSVVRHSDGKPCISGKVKRSLAVLTCGQDTVKGGSGYNEGRPCHVNLWSGYSEGRPCRVNLWSRFSEGRLCRVNLWSRFSEGRPCRVTVSPCQQSQPLLQHGHKSDCRFYIARFSASVHTHLAFVACDSERVSACGFTMRCEHPSVYLQRCFGNDTAGAT